MQLNVIYFQTVYGVWCLYIQLPLHYHLSDSEVTYC